MEKLLGVTHKGRSYIAEIKSENDFLLRDHLGVSVHSSELTQAQVKEIGEFYKPLRSARRRAEFQNTVNSVNWWVVGGVTALIGAAFAAIEYLL